MPPNNKGKGKDRADPVSERTPLLGGGSGAAASVRSVASDSSASTAMDTSELATAPARARSRRFAVLVVLYSLVLGVAVFVVLLALSFVPTDMEKRDLHTAFVYEDPRVDILNVLPDGVHINLTLRGGVDVDRALAVDGRRGAGWWEGLRRSSAHAVLGALPTQAVHLSIPQVLVSSGSGGGKSAGIPLLNVSIPQDVIVPLTRGGALVPIAIEAVGSPLAPAGELWTWGQQTWANGTIDVVVDVPDAQASIPGAWWSRWAVIDQSDIAVPLAVQVPPVPNLPPPGTPLDLSKLVTLNDYSFSTDKDQLKITATASVPNPSLRSVPFAFPFAIQIGAEHATIAEVVATPARVTPHSIDLLIEGDIVDLASGDALDAFLENFLKGRDNPIVVRGMNSMPAGHESPPQWVLDSLPSLALDLVFPAPDERPDIVKSVTIEDMQIGQGSGQMVANGTVIAQLELPRQMHRVVLNVSALRPDVLIYNGPVDADADDEYDPDHPPPRAFGRIHPDYYLPSTTHATGPQGGPEVRAAFTNLPLVILPGRDGVLSDFVARIVFKGGATAGIAGLVDVQADVGIGGVLGIGGLPVKGEFWAGRKLGLEVGRAGFGGGGPAELGLEVERAGV